MSDWAHLFMLQLLTAAERALHRWAGWHRAHLPPGPPVVRPPLDLRPPLDEPVRGDGQKEFAW
jgi:hypothetical protein